MKNTKNAVFALGIFDGVHCGHQKILRGVSDEAKALQGTPCVYTFNPHPIRILSPETPFSLIQTPDQKKRALEAAGIQICIVEPFPKQLSALSPEDFFHNQIQKQLQPVSIWVGYDFTFGHKRSGTVKTLKELWAEANIRCHIVEPQYVEETLVHSKLIREQVQRGGVEMAKELLSRPFALLGTVIRGQGIGGKKLGVHTANLSVENELLPGIGVYITQTRTSSGLYPSVTNVGNNPTFEGKGFSIETHILNFDQNLKDQKIEVEFLRWLRPEEKFSSAEALAKVIQNDILETERYHGLHA